MSNTLYVLVNKKYNKSYQAAQCCHAVAEYVKQNPESPWNNGKIILLKTSCLSCYADLADAIWREPDQDDQITAVAALNIGDEISHWLML